MENEIINAEEIVETMVCQKCGKELSLDKFIKNNRVICGIVPKCKECGNKEQKIRRAKKKSLFIKVVHANKNTKICTKCGKELSLNKFNKDIHGLNGLHPRCNECERKISKEYERLNKLKQLTTPLAKTKICTNCGQELTIDKFSTEDRTKDGLNRQCKECIRGKHRKFYSKNRIRLSEIKKIESLKYRKENRVKILERSKKYYSEHKFEISLAKKKNYTNNKYAIGECVKLWKRENKDKVNITNERRRAKKALLPHTLTLEQWNECLIFFDYKDAYTGLPMKCISQDHVIPLAKGGWYVRQNIIPCESYINSRKHDTDMETWYKSQEFYDEKRLNKIYEWMGYENDVQQLSFI